MGSRSTCDLNYVEISENDENIATTRFCGSDNPAPYKAKSNQLEVRFRSGSYFDGTGWIVTFMGVHENSVLDQI